MVRYHFTCEWYHFCSSVICIDFTDKYKINRGSYIRGHLIWNLLNSLYNFGILRAFGDIRGHLIWNLWNSLCNFSILRAEGEGSQNNRIRLAKYRNYTTSFINFILNDHECKILFITWPLQRSYTLKITQVRRSIAVWTTCGHWFCSITQWI